MKSFVLASVCLLCLIVSSVQAAGRFYVEPNASRDKLKLQNAEFSIYSTGLKLGVHLAGHHGFEVQYSQGSKEEELNSLKVELGSRMGVFYRYGSLPSRPIRGYVLLGQSRTVINYDGPTQSSEEELEDFAWAIGAEEKLKRWNPAIFNVEYAQHYNHQDDIYYIISLGLRYEF